MGVIALDIEGIVVTDRIPAGGGGDIGRALGRRFEGGETGKIIGF
jgi:hypothetical protein